MYYFCSDFINFYMFNSIYYLNDIFTFVGTTKLCSYFKILQDDMEVVIFHKDILYVLGSRTGNSVRICIYKARSTLKYSFNLATGIPKPPSRVVALHASVESSACGV